VSSYFYALLEPEELNNDLLRGVDCRQTLCELQVNDRPGALRLYGSMAEDKRRLSYRSELVDGGQLYHVIIAREGGNQNIISDPNGLSVL
jgi:hypothetical protein